MKRLLTTLMMVMLVGSMTPAGSAQAPSAGGISTDNLEYITSIPFEGGTTTGARVIGKYMYVTSWRSFSIYDVSDPEAPALVSTTQFGQDSPDGATPARFENEDVATNGEILIFSQELPDSQLFVYDIEDKTNPTLLSLTPELGQHTMSCILDCKWLYGSDGFIIDLRDPAAPKLQANKWDDGLTLSSGGHDVTEVKKGIVLTATDPMLVLDARKNPAKPKVRAMAQPMEEFIHSVAWPKAVKGKLALSTGETWVPGADAQCTENSAGFSTWSTKKWKKTRTLKRIDTLRPKNGTYTDGNPVINAPFGCSAHWFQEHPTFNNGGLVAVGYYNHGTRILRVSKAGKISEEAWFIPHAGGTSAAYWVTDRIVYAMDYQRGIYVMKYTGKF
jgi:LVIVD repeat